ncbi:MAG: hypothetical protein IT521_04830 [Burkholderiales bacterium]|nr:hypothetical protein [Burkholderiales bacterium]
MSLNSNSLSGRSSRRSQRGVVLFVALIGMVILSLASVALIRAIDSSSGVAGNLAFRQASIAPVNQAIEKAVDAIFKSKTIGDLNSDDATHNYFAALQASEKANAVPNVLAGAYPPSGYSMVVDTDATTGIEVRSVVERVCNANGAPTLEHCDLLPPKVSPGGTDNEIGSIPLPPIPHFRVTVRVDLPNTNAVSYAQAFLR